MDKIRACRMTKELIGKYIGNCKVIAFSGNGKSALVFKGEYQGQECAIKIFDPEMVERSGEDAQLQRIQRELSIKNNGCKNLVRIIDGGKCQNTGYLFIVMEYLNLPTLESVIKLIPRNNIDRIISQIAGAAQHLESLGLCHRDIKPSNIVITTDYQEATLLDLGVLKLVGNSDLTDNKAPDFIGTLRYSSPEFLMREEEDTIEGWRAVTFYQLGAVLYDLIMRKPIFYEYSSPYANLVQAIEHQVPEIEADDVSPDLINLAKTCLIKDPTVRIRLVQWDSFSLPKRSPQTLKTIKKRVRQRNVVAQLEKHNIIQSADDYEKRRSKQVLKEILNSLENIIRLECTGNKDFPPAQISNNSNQIEVIFPPSLAHQLSSLLYLVITVELLDVGTKAINLTYLTAVSIEEVELIPKEESYSLFQGSYEEVTIRDRIMALLYMAFDKGQQVNIESGTKLKLLGPYDIGGK